MRKIFGNSYYEIEVEETTKKGDVGRTWRYYGKNVATEKEFDYSIEFSEKAFEGADNLTRSDVAEAIRTNGESLIQRWLSEDRGYWIKAVVTEKDIKIEAEKKDKHSRLL